MGFNGLSIKMLEVFHIPRLEKHLLSVGNLDRRGMKVEFQNAICVIWCLNRALFKGKKDGNAHVLY